MPRIFVHVFLFVFCISAGMPRALASGDNSLRGLEQNESHFSDPLLNTASGLLYPVRQIFDFTLYGAGAAAAELSDPDFVRRVKDILYLYKEDLLWFPIVSYASGFRPEYGAGLLYKAGGSRHLFRGTVHDAHYWSMDLKSSYEREIRGARVKASFIGELEEKDDFQFYGLGSDPRDDPRNTFLADNDYGVFSQERRRFGGEIKLRPNDFWDVTYAGFYERKSFNPSGRGHDELYQIMDVARIPGFSAPVAKFYNEISLKRDTREKKKMLSPGWRGEIYSGISSGLRQNHSEHLRAGLDAAAFIPTTTRDRLIVPRLAMDIVESLDGEAIPFSEYPRAVTFRGVSARKWVKSERMAFVPSLEYQWPLSHMLSGHLFTDLLFTGSSPASIGWSETLWAVGCGLDFHYLNSEWARLEFAGGSEGVHFSLTLGMPMRVNKR